MSTDPTLDAALAYARPSLLRRAWNWYRRLTGYEKAALQRLTGLKIKSTAYPSATTPTFPIGKNHFLKDII